MTKEIKISEKSNGYYVIVDQREYVYRSVDILQMLAFVGKELYGKRVEVIEK